MMCLVCCMHPCQVILWSQVSCSLHIGAVPEFSTRPVSLQKIREITISVYLIGQILSYVQPYQFASHSYLQKPRLQGGIDPNRNVPMHCLWYFETVDEDIIIKVLLAYLLLLAVIWDRECCLFWSPGTLIVETVAKMEIWVLWKYSSDVSDLLESFRFCAKSDIDTIVVGHWL